MIDDTNNEMIEGEGVMIDVSSMDLKNKVTVTEEGIDPSQLEKAESIIANMSDSYLDWAMEDISKLEASFTELVQNVDNYEDKLKNVFNIAHDMKGQGGSFGYDLVTEIGNYLCRFIERIQSKPTQKLLDVIKLHIDAMKMILIGQIKGSGGAKGGAILDGLEATLQKYTPDLVEAAHRLKQHEEKEENQNEE